MKIQVKLKLLDTSQGGRTGPIHSGNTYDFSLRPGSDEIWSAKVVIYGSEFCYPGQECQVELSPIRPEEWQKRASGNFIEMREGKRAVAHGKAQAPPLTTQQSERAKKHVQAG